MEITDGAADEYTNRELDAKYTAIHNKLDELIIHVKATNGSVILLEEKVSKLERWQSFIMGGVAVLCVFVVPILLYIIYRMVNL